LRTLREIQEEMSLGERARFNSPITARQRVTKKLAEKYAPPEPGEVPEKGPTEKEKLKESVRRLEEDLTAAHAKIKQLEKLDGGLFDLVHDTANDIAATIVRSISPTKAGDIARAIQKAIKAAKAAHAGLGGCKVALCPFGDVAAVMVSFEPSGPIGAFQAFAAPEARQREFALPAVDAKTAITEAKGRRDL
jgi:hypothetical protein